jgi:hypothetical protein
MRVYSVGFHEDENIYKKQIENLSEEALEKAWVIYSFSVSYNESYGSALLYDGTDIYTRQLYWSEGKKSMQDWQKVESCGYANVHAKVLLKLAELI